jgi:2,4-dienoyl-CoA reductase-like NADH-dependent reductase (Old Yellow Enzyme family)
MSKLLSPLTIRDIRLKNRIVISPMCQYSSIDGFANDWHLVHLGARALGGAALIIQEATAVSPEGRISPGDAGIYNDEHIEGWRRVTQFLEEHGAVPGIQLAHAGRKASCAVPWKGGKELPLDAGGWNCVAPSAIPFRDGDRLPIALDEAGIKKVIRDFKSAAERALKTGYQLIEIHAAHGYLLNEFLSPLANHREDQYGGSFENRTRLLLEVVDTVRTVWPARFPLFIRISASDWAERGWKGEDSVRLAGILKTRAVDLVDCSSGGLVPNVKIPLGPGYQVPFAEKIRKETGMLTGAVGLITDVQQAEEILEKEQADLIIIARASLRDPNFALHAAKEFGEEIEWPIQYERAKK